MAMLPNGPRLSCGRLARRRKSNGRQSVPRQGHNTPLPLKRSPPISFKRLLGSIIVNLNEFCALGAYLDDAPAFHVEAKPCRGSVTKERLPTDVEL